MSCRGFNGYGQLGYGDKVNRGGAASQMGDMLPFVDLGTGRTAAQVACGGNDDPNYSAYNGFTCAILDNGKVKCWGNNFDGRLGLGYIGDVGIGAGQMGDALPTIDLGRHNFSAVQLAAGTHHTCALFSNQRLKCWGRDEHGGTGLGVSYTVIGDVASEMGDGLAFLDLGADVLSVSVGYLHTCAVLAGGVPKVRGCGHNTAVWVTSGLCCNYLGCSACAVFS